MSELETFRTKTRAWLEENCPASMRTPMPEREMPWGGRNASYPNPDTKVWMDNMASRGWTAPTWPAEYGGGGLSKEENKILQEELTRIKARPALTSFGLWMLGPALLEFASVRVILSPVLALIWLVCKPRPKTRATIIW